MTPAELLAGLAARGARLLLHDGRLRYRGPAALLTPRLRAAVAAHRPALRALLTPPAPDPPSLGEGRVGVFPDGGIRDGLRAFAASGRVLHVQSAVLGTTVSLAADNADISHVPSDRVVFWPDELAAILASGPAFLALLHEAKRCFDPHGRTLPDLEDDSSHSATLTLPL